LKDALCQIAKTCFNRLCLRQNKSQLNATLNHRLGEITMGTDFRLGSGTVRNPDVAFVTAQHLKSIDIDRSPVTGAPALAVEVVSPSNSAEDMMAKVRQYLAAGSLAVWVVYPRLRLVEVHDAAGTQEVVEPAVLEAHGVFGISRFLCR
jgi:Uma2 family endonuclease